MSTIVKLKTENAAVDVVKILPVSAARALRSCN